MTDEKTFLIATCNRRTDKTMTNQKITWPDFLEKVSHPCRTRETLEEYLQMAKGERDDLKDVGGFVGGCLQDGRRKKGCVKSRSMLVLDLDYAKSNTWYQIKQKFTFCCCVYSTRSYTVGKPRLRLVIPLAFDVSPEEYEAIARLLADMIGMELFDSTTFPPERMMYWPSVSTDGEFFFDSIDGPWLNPDEPLGMYDDWQDTSTWPRHHRENKIPSAQREPSQPKEAGCNGDGMQADPLEKPGVIGAFCRAYYPITAAVDTSLSGVYAPSVARRDRYDYVPADSTAGVEIYDDRYIFSHHETDPLHDMLLNAFDMVRLHKFGDLDADCPPEMPIGETPSFKAMIEFALADEKVQAELDAEHMQQTLDDFPMLDDENDNKSDGNGCDDGARAGGNAGGSCSGGGGNRGNSNNSNASGDGDDGNSNSSGNAGGKDGSKKKQQIMKVKKCLKRIKGKIATTLPNLITILEMDPSLKGFALNQFMDYLEVTDDLPWKRASESKCWSDYDDAQLLAYLHTYYAPFSATLVNKAVAKVAADRSYHPIRDHIKGLPDWDGTKRVDRLLVEYLGAEDTDYVHAVTRKTLCAAICRVLSPGCKFDCMPVLVGPQGVGKSTLIAKLGNPWFSDSLSFCDLHDKTAAEKLQGIWIMEIGELTGMKKVEVETIRSFVSSQNDRYRAAYDKRATPHPRQCIFIATTNATTGFLRDTTGNRRFWPIKISGSGTKRTWDLTEDDIKQIWAEANVYVQHGETLYLDNTLEAAAMDAQREAMECDEREGLVQKYLETLLPARWDDMSLEQRCNYLHNPVAGTIQRKQVSRLEIWCECFNKRPEDLRRSDSLDIAAILTRLGWQKSDTRKRIPIYGSQWVFTP